MAKVIYTESPGTLVLVAGDSDYYRTLLEAKSRSLILEIGGSGHFKGDDKIRYTQLEAYYKFFVYATGPKSDYYNKMETLEIIYDTIVEDKEIVEWFANLNLFSWIHREGETIIIYLYNERELNIAKEWIVRDARKYQFGKRK